MFFSRATSGLPDQPRQGAGLRARIVRRCGELGAALCGVVAGRLRRRTAAPITPDGLSRPAPEQPDALLPQAPARRRRRYSRAADARLIDAVFPGLGSEARALLNTPAGECDPAMLEATLALLCEAIAQTMTPREGLQDAQDLFAAFRSGFAAILGEAPATAPDLPADTAEPAADPAAVATRDQPAAAPDAAAPALPQDSNQSKPDGAAGPSAAATINAAHAAPAPAPTAPGTNSDIDPNARSTRVPHTHRRRLPTARRTPSRARLGFAARQPAQSCLTRTMAPRRGRPCLPPRLLAYAACAGPP